MSSDLQKLHIADEKPSVQVRESPDREQAPPVMKHGIGGNKLVLC